MAVSLDALEKASTDAINTLGIASSREQYESARLTELAALKNPESLGLLESRGIRPASDIATTSQIHSTGTSTGVSR